jgi:NodT family efflux transporter outer membrane factor (OMF) lipoprotein
MKTDHLNQADKATAALAAASRTPLLALVAALALAGCASMTDVKQQAQMRDVPAVGQATAGAPASKLQAEWWREFGDEQLNSLIAKASVNSPNLQMVQTRLRKAQVGVDAAEADKKPQLGGQLDLTKEQFNRNGIYPPPLAGTTRDIGTLQLNGSWELDFFGKHRSALDAALGNVRAAQADAEAARLLLSANVARTYFQMLRYNDQLKIARRVLAQREDLLKLVQQRKAAGLDTQLELRQSESGLPDAKLQIEMLQEQLALAHNALAALVADQAAVDGLTLPALDSIKLAANPGYVAADTLGQRPDVWAARMRVEAATHDIDVAKTLFYPNVNLLAFAGFNAIGLDRLFDSGSQQWGITPAVRLPIFEGGRLKANLRGKAVDLDAAITSYNAAVVEAVHEATDQLASGQAIARQQAQQREAQTLADGSYDITTQRYQAGLVTSLTVLNAESAVLFQHRQAVDLNARALDNRVALLRAMGGGFVPDAPSTVAQAKPAS